MNQKLLQILTQYPSFDCFPEQFFCHLMLETDNNKTCAIGNVYDITHMPYHHHLHIFLYIHHQNRLLINFFLSSIDFTSKGNSLFSTYFTCVPNALSILQPMFFLYKHLLSHNLHRHVEKNTIKFLLMVLNLFFTIFLQKASTTQQIIFTRQNLLIDFHYSVFDYYYSIGYLILSATFISSPS